MNVCILGWYGTETMGDRAILDGIIKIFSKTFNESNITIGSLYPFFTERTLLEDKKDYLNECDNIKLSIFDEKSYRDLKQNILNSNLVIMGGGPIMDINEVFIISNAFKFAKKNNIKTCLFGCGLGPLNDQKFIRETKKILKYTDIGIFRDNISKELAEKFYQNKKFYYLPDPAIVSILFYKNKYGKNLNKNNDIIINFREHPDGYKNDNFEIDSLLIGIVKDVSAVFDNVQLIPMHTFFIGGDDRVFLSKISNRINVENIKVIHKPINLYEMYKIYSEAKACIGMRYHSVVMQTILNGNNYIIDYTSPKTGKISGFINELTNKDFYSNRYYNYTTGEKISASSVKEILNGNKKYNYEYTDIISKYFDILTENL